MFSRSRRAELNYGSAGRTVNYMTAFEDVFVRERSADDPQKLALRYATGGRADFDNVRNVVVFSEFPQVYEDNDTMTGDLITLHRDSDLVEVEHSNAYSEGSKTSGP